MFLHVLQRDRYAHANLSWTCGPIHLLAKYRHDATVTSKANIALLPEVISFSNNKAGLFISRTPSSPAAIWPASSRQSLRPYPLGVLSAPLCPRNTRAASHKLCNINLAAPNENHPMVLSSRIKKLLNFTK